MGFHACLEPLPGDHVLELGGTIGDGDEPWLETSATDSLQIDS